MLRTRQDRAVICVAVAGAARWWQREGEVVFPQRRNVGGYSNKAKMLALTSTFTDISSTAENAATILANNKWAWEVIRTT